LLDKDCINEVIYVITDVAVIVRGFYRRGRRGRRGERDERVCWERIRVASIGVSLGLKLSKNFVFT
jgi:hypothetical protein